MIGLTILNIIVNMGIMGFASLKELKRVFIKLVRKIKASCFKRKAVYKEPIIKEDSNIFESK